MSEKEALEFFRQLCEGYQSLFELRISHRDLKPENLLLCDKVLKISDFGFVKVNENFEIQSKSGKKSRFMAESLVGSINYMAPDILISEIENKSYNPFKSDVWSMGIILYKMLYGKEPYIGQSTVDLLDQIKKKPLSFPESIPVSEETISLMKQMIEIDEKARISFKELRKVVVEEVESKDKGGEKTSRKWPEKPTLKEKYLIFYNTLMMQLSFDAANFATLREIGFEDYQKISSILMTKLHQMRTDMLEKFEGGQDVYFEIKNEIAIYHNTFYEAIKQNVELEQSDKGILGAILKEFYDKLKEYTQFEYFLLSVQFFLLNLLLLYNLENKNVTIDYIFMILQKENKIKSFEKLKKDNFRD